MLSSLRLSADALKGPLPAGGGEAPACACEGEDMLCAEGAVEGRGVAVGMSEVSEGDD